jgi:hypothetical protein
VDIHRERSRSAKRVEDIELYASSEEQGLVSFEDKPESALETDEKRIVIGRAIANLPTRLRETFILHFYQELSYPEIAQQQNISYQNVCKRISQARAILRKELREYFIENEGADTELSVPPTATKSAIGEMSEGNAGVEAEAGETVLVVAVEEVEIVGGEEFATGVDGIFYRGGWDGYGVISALKLDRKTELKDSINREESRHIYRNVCSKELRNMQSQQPIIVLDGHGADVSGKSFEFKRQNRMTLYSYTFTDRNVWVSASNEKIKAALTTGMVPEGWSNQQDSKIGGTPVVERILWKPDFYDQQTKEGWFSEDEVKAWDKTIVWTKTRIEKLEDTKQKKVATLNLLHNGSQVNNSQRMLGWITDTEKGVYLSTILQAGELAQLSAKVLWLACRGLDTN